MGLATIIKKGTVGCMLEIAIRSSTTGQLLTGLTAADMTIEYQRQGAAAHVSVTPVVGTLGTWASGSWAESVPGVYQFGVPNAALAAGADFVVIVFTSAGSLDADTMIYLTASDLQDAVDLGLTNLTASVFSLPVTYPPSSPAGTVYAQFFCTVNDLLNDPAPPAGDVEILFKEIQAASRTIQEEIGEFIPVSEIRKFSANLTMNGISRLFIPPMLGLLGSIVNDDITLVAADYILQPGERHWRNGPYSWLEVDPDASNLSAWSDEQDGIVIPARWGLYEESEVTGSILGAAQSDVETNLQVSDGSKISPGAVLLISSEQELVTGYEAPLAAITTLNGGIDATQETIVLTNGALVTVGEIIRIGVEQMRILDIATHTCYVQRHWNKTLGAVHSTGASVDVYRMFTVVRGVNGIVAAAHDISTAISRYLVPGDVLFLCKEIATLMVNKASSNYAGRTGNQELGTVFYNDAFPRYDLERIRDHYSIKTVR
jgi:hypothetical protein